MFASNNAAHQVDVPGTLFPPDVSKSDIAICELPLGAKFEVRTKRHVYQVENCGGGLALITGHPTYCPKPVLVDLVGSCGDGALYRIRRIVRGAHMEFVHPIYGLVRTSRITDIHEIEVPSDNDAPVAKAS
jgi:hypothetical protein